VIEMAIDGWATEVLVGRISDGRSLPARVALTAVLALAGCAPAEGPVDGSRAPASPVPSGLVAGKPTVTTNGPAIQIVGLGTGTTPEFDLPAGAAEIRVTACASNQVPPFVQLFDGNGNGMGFIVDPVYQLKNLAGGKYYLAIQANPDCVWTIDLTPK
jgi:hypothetical protein